MEENFNYKNYLKNNPLLAEIKINDPKKLFIFIINYTYGLEDFYGDLYNYKNQLICKDTETFKIKNNTYIIIPEYSIHILKKMDLIKYIEYIPSLYVLPFKYVRIQNPKNFKIK